MSPLFRSLVLPATVLALACDAGGALVSESGVAPIFASSDVGSHHGIPLVSHTGYSGTGLVNVSVTASDPGPTDQGFTVQGEFTLHGAAPSHTFFIARKADFMPPVLDCTTIATWNPFIEWLDAATPTSPPVFSILTTSAGGAGAAHFYVRSTSPLLADGSVFSARFTILDDTDGSGTPSTSDTEAYVSDGCVNVTVK